MPRPAFTEPPPVPPCTTPVAAPVQPGAIGTALAGANVPDRLVLTPAKIVAPVGSEVVLLAGLCGPDGQYLAKQPIEWVLSQESVGNFVGVGEDNHPTLSHLLHKTPQKMSGNFALGRTAHQARAITRGTPAANDDIWLQKGQGWVTLTSISEGTSNVTAIASKSENWEQRRQTATIQWIDAQWVFPTPAIARAGQTQLLTTVVSRGTNGSPAPNWLVRYTIVSGPAAAFGADRAQTVQVITDANGRAPVNVQPLTTEPGVTQMRVEILSPSLSGADGQPVVVGQGMTTVTWSSAGLALRILGPTTGTVDSTLTYQIEVSNPGDLPTQNIVVTAELPPLLKPMGIDEGIRGNNVEWRIDALTPRATQTITLQCRAVRGGDVRLFVRARAGDIQANPAHFDTQIIESALKLTMELAGGVDSKHVKVGDRISYNVQVTNSGNFPLTNVQVRDVFDLGLEHAEGERSPIVKWIGGLAPGASSRLAVTFNVREAGDLCHTLNATADGGHAVTQRLCIHAEEVNYDLSVQVGGPTDLTLGTADEYEIKVSNLGDAELTGLRIEFRTEESLMMSEASPDFTVQQGGLVWHIPALPPKESQRWRVKCKAAGIDDAAEMRVAVSTTQGLTETTTLAVKIRPAGTAPANPPATRPATPPAQPQPPASNTVKLTVADTADPIRVGESTVYLIEIQNDRRTADKALQVNFFLSPGFRMVNITSNGMPLDPGVDAGGLTIALRPISEVRAGEKLPPIRLELKAEKPGVLWVRTEVTSQLTPQPVVLTHETTVRAN